MPNILTHNLFADDVLVGIADKKLIEIINEYPKEYHIGASGPDFFFYYDVYPWQDQKENARVASIGGIVHAEKINDFYKMAISICHAQKESSLKKAMISFLAGHFCHWALDSSAHPMIFNRTNGTTKETRYWHYRLESMIDTMMVIDIKKENLKKYPTTKMMDYDNLSVEAITAIYQPILKELWDIEVEASLIEKCLHDFKSVNRILFNPPMPFFYTMQLLEGLIGKRWIFTSHMILKKTDKQHDILNLNHNKWRNPCDQSSIHHESFLDLYEMGKENCVEVLNLLSKGIHSDDSTAITEILNNRSYETGLSVKKEMKYFNSIY